MAGELTKSERETLKAVYRHTREGGAAHTSVLASTLGVSPATVTSTVKRLAERDLVDHTPYRGVEFTPEGRRAAIAAIRRHRIVERFLADMLGYAWNEADRLATSFEHDLPPEVEDRLYVALDRPAACPHGFPIPEPEQDEMPSLPTLYALGVGDVAEVAVPGSVDSEVVQFLETLGVRPGVQVEVREKHPFDGPMVVRVEGNDRTLGDRIARQIYVSRLEAGNGASEGTKDGTEIPAVLEKEGP
jgi:DtxR family Mn-dependent transcriptional regulator